jgi:hypothetical protein
MSAALLRVRTAAKAAFDALSSIWLSMTVLAFLFLVTVLGTLEQTRTSLYEVQKRYFESAFVLHDLGPVRVPLPGVYLLLVVLGINLILGGIVRIRKSRTTWGVIVAHVGIVAMLAGAAVEYGWSEKGHATLAEGSTAAEFKSYYEWEIAIAEATETGPVVEHVVPGERFAHVVAGERVTCRSTELPFDLVVREFLPNCEPRASSVGVEGVALTALPREKEAEQDAAGAYVTVQPKSGAKPVEGLLWSRQRAPMPVVVEGRRFAIDLSHRRRPLPFSVRLDDFRRDLHPGMGMAKAFESDVTKVKDGVPQTVRISMNQPLRESGYTLYQSGFIEPENSADRRWWSTFSVVRNPADRVPLWSCVVISVGLLLHFSQKLVRHVRAQTARRA